MTDIAEAKRLIAVASTDGMRLLGAGVYRHCSQARYNDAATAALNDPATDLSPEERRLIASHIEHEDSENRMGYTLRVRLSEAERAELETAAGEADLSLSEYARRAMLEVR